LSSSERQADTPAVDGWLHFAGIGGSGMSGLAQYHAQAGRPCSGSDRAFDDGRHPEIRAGLERTGAIILPQDGSFVTAGRSDGPLAGRSCAAVVVSTAVEDKVPDVKAAREAGIPILHRSELLAHHVATHRTIAVSGTSGKSTVTGMVFTILRAGGLGPGLLTGGPLAALTAAGHIGNAWAPRPAAGAAPLLVIEADESDGSLVRYRPWAGVVLNLGLDHKEPAEVLAMFTAFKANVTGPLVVAADANLTSLHEGAHLCGVGPDPRPGTWAEDVELMPDGSAFTVAGTRFILPVPGLYNVLNATAAIAVCRQAGLEVADMAAPLADFAGIGRRFQKIGAAAGCEVIDDFAHNPDKIAAALTAARRRTTGRVLAVFQPHGYGPTRFLRRALVDTFAASLDPGDLLWLPEIYFAGGTVTRDISSSDLVAEILARGREARFLPRREDIPRAIADEARPGDVIIVMGARDPSLTGFCRDILGELADRS